MTINDVTVEQGFQFPFTSALEDRKQIMKIINNNSPVGGGRTRRMWSARNFSRETLYIECHATGEHTPKKNKKNNTTNTKNNTSRNSRSAKVGCTA